LTFSNLEVSNPPSAGLEVLLNIFLDGLPRRFSCDRGRDGERQPAHDSAGRNRSKLSLITFKRTALATLDLRVLAFWSEGANHTIPVGTVCCSSIGR
jgi:hypothetical protein